MPPPEKSSETHLVRRSSMVTVAIVAAVTGTGVGGGVGYSTKAAVSEAQLQRAQHDIIENRTESLAALAELKKETNESIKVLADLIAKRDEQYSSRFERQEIRMSNTDARVSALHLDIKEDLVAIKTAMGLPNKQKK